MTTDNATTLNATLLRLRILAAVAQGGEASPKTISQKVDANLGLVAYHVRALARGGLLKRSREQRVRGAIQTFYRVTPAARDYTWALRVAAIHADNLLATR